MRPLLVVYVWASTVDLLMVVPCKTWNDVMTKIEYAGQQFPVKIHCWSNASIVIDVTVGS